MEKEEEYIKLLRILLEIGEANKGIPVGDDDRILDAEGLVLKFVGDAGSLLYLSRSTKLPEIGANFFDSPSINVIGRAAMETFLTFHYIFIAPSSDEDKDFRYLSWQLAGLLERQSYSIRSLEGKKKLKKEMEYIKSLLSKINDNAIFKQLSIGEQKEIRKGKWRRLNWREIAVSAGLSERHAKEFYSYLCEYAHSGNLSILQFRQAENAESQKDLFAATMSLVMITMANIIKSYCILFPKSQYVVDRNPEYVHLIDIWTYVGSN